MAPVGTGRDDVFVPSSASLPLSSPSSTRSLTPASGRPEADDADRLSDAAAAAACVAGSGPAGAHPEAMLPRAASPAPIDPPAYHAKTHAPPVLELAMSSTPPVSGNGLIVAIPGTTAPRSPMRAPRRANRDRHASDTSVGFAHSRPATPVSRWRWLLAWPSPASSHTGGYAPMASLDEDLEWSRDRAEPLSMQTPSGPPAGPHRGPCMTPTATPPRRRLQRSDHRPAASARRAARPRRCRPAALRALVMAHANVLSAIMNLSNTIIGPGMLSVAWAFSVVGIVPGLALCVVSGFVSWFSMRLLITSARMAHHREAARLRRCPTDAVLGMPRSRQSSWYPVTPRETPLDVVTEGVPLPVLAHPAGMRHVSSATSRQWPSTLLPDPALRESEDSYAFLAFEAFGRAGAVWADVCMLVMTFGTSISYLVCIADFLPRLLHDGFPGSADPVNHPYAALWTSRTMVLLVLLPGLVKLSARKTLDNLATLSAFALLAAAYLAIYVIGYAVAHVPHAVTPPKTELVLIRWECLHALPIFVFAFTCHQNLFEVYNELLATITPTQLDQHESQTSASHVSPFESLASFNENSVLAEAEASEAAAPLPTSAQALAAVTQRQVHRVINIAIVFSIVLYALVGYAGYVTFGASVTSSLIDQYPAGWARALAQIAFLVSAIASYPLQIHPCCAALDNLIVAATTLSPGTPERCMTSPHAGTPSGSAGIASGTSGIASATTPWDGVHPEGGVRRVLAWMRQCVLSNDPRWKAATTSLMTLAAWAVAVDVTELDRWLALMGATGGIAVAYVLPGWFFMRLRGRSQTRRWRAVVSCILILSGILAGSLSLIYITL